MRRILLTTAALFLAPLSAWAQEAPAGEEGLEEIIVTAQRREENLQNAAVPVDVVQGEELLDRGITELGRLSEVSPALVVQPSSAGNSIFMRGVGNFTLTANSDPATAFNYDGVYIGRPSTTYGTFYDLSRVEILKGPQGILYGRNATGGAVNVIPQTPIIGETSGYLSTSFGNFDSFTAEGALNIALGENSAFRAAMSSSSRDGYMNDGTDDDETTAFRLQFLTEITPELRVRIAGDYAEVGGAGVGIGYTGRYAFVPGPGGGYVFQPATVPVEDGVFTPGAQAFRTSTFVVPARRLLDAAGPYPYRDNRFGGVSAEINYETGIGTWTFVPAWRHTTIDQASIGGGFPFLSDEEAEQFSAELRLNGSRIGIFDYTLGLYYYNEQVDSQTTINLSSQIGWSSRQFETDSFAPFASVTANVTDDFRIVGGARWTSDSKDFTSVGVSGTVACQVAAPPFCPAAPLFPTVSGPSGLPFAFPAMGGPPILNNGALVIRGDSLFNSSLSNDDTTYRFALEYDVAERSMLYASVETGYRSGGFSAAVGFETYDPEYITAYTLGMKNRLFDNRLQLNLEAFLWEYTDQQVSHVGLDAVGRTAQFIENIGESTIQGAEVEVRWLLTPNTMISSNIQYLDAQNDSFVYQVGVGAPGTPPPLTGCLVGPSGNPALYNVDCSGLPAFNSPEWTLNFGIEQTIPLGGFQIRLGADTQYRGERYIGFDYLPQQLVDETWTSNAHVGFGPDDSRWEILAYIRNIEDERYGVFSPVHPLAGFVMQGLNPPQTYGVRLSASF
ncbi:MAG: TonB-dependent receptor [Hyphomonadaceae bacterium]